MTFPVSDLTKGRGEIGLETTLVLYTQPYSALHSLTQPYTYPLYTYLDKDLHVVPQNAPGKEAVRSRHRHIVPN